MATEYNVFRLLDMVQINPEPFPNADEAILFAFAQPHDERMVVMNRYYKAFSVRNGKVERVIEPYELTRRPSPTVPLGIPKSHST